MKSREIRWKNRNHCAFKWWLWSMVSPRTSSYSSSPFLNPTAATRGTKVLHHASSSHVNLPLHQPTWFCHSILTKLPKLLRRTKGFLFEKDEAERAGRKREKGRKEREDKLVFNRSRNIALWLRQPREKSLRHLKTRWPCLHSVKTLNRHIKE